MEPVQADLINALFETTSFVALFNHCRVLVRDKEVKGVSILSTLFFTTWGYWNLYYYRLLDQELSFYGCILTATANTLWVALMVWYGIVAPWRARNERRVGAAGARGHAASSE